jgi:hypothetical protein
LFEDEEREEEGKEKEEGGREIKEIDLRMGMRKKRGIKKKGIGGEERENKSGEDEKKKKVK